MRVGVVCERVEDRDAKSSPGSATSALLDSRFLEQSNRRLALVSAVFAGVVAALVLSAFVLYGPLGWEAPHHLTHFLAAQTVLFLLSLGMAVVAWRRLLPARTTLKVGLAYQLLGALVLSVCAFSGDMLLQGVGVKLSWLAVWILLFPLLIPSRPLRSLVVSTLCATTAPAVFFVWSLAEGQALPRLPVLAETFLPYYVCAGLAVVPAWLVFDLGSAATTARDTVRQLGSYRLVELLGRGGMGEVWRAEHALLARPAAVKLVHLPTTGTHGTPPLQDRSEVLARFEREAQTIAALTSPHTVSLYDYGVTDDGTLYYAMELLEGIDLEELVDRFGPLSPARAIYLLRQVCESLSEAHAAGLVHRDIKPSNLMACHVGNQVDFVKVLDFGLVRRMKPAEQDPRVSDADYVVGTPAFMAPELAKSPTEVDSRADVYAIGCVAYWLLTGHLVFEQSTAAGIIADHVHAPPPIPSAKTRQAIPPELEELIINCLAKTPRLRPQTVDDLHERLARITVAQPWTQQRAHMWWRARLRELVPDEGPAAEAESAPAVEPPQDPTPTEPAPRVDHAVLDYEPRFASYPRVAVSAISEIRIRARQRQYARARDESRLARAQVTADSEATS